MSKDFYLAAIPEPFTILGVRLLRFSPGKIILLHRINSPFAVGGNVTREHLESAIWLCSFPFRVAEETLYDTDGTAKEIKRWRRTIGRNIDLKSACHSFEDYIRKGSVCPRFIPKGESAQVILDVDTVQIVRAGLKRFDEAYWDEPWGQLLWDYFTLKAMEGAGDLTGESSIEQALGVAEELQKKFSGKAVPGA